jgi:hypothetical protein
MIARSQQSLFATSVQNSGFVCNDVIKVPSLEQKVLSGKLSCGILVGNYFNRLLVENACLNLTNA